MSRPICRPRVAGNNKHGRIKWWLRLQWSRQIGPPTDPFPKAVWLLAAPLQHPNRASLRQTACATRVRAHRASNHVHHARITGKRDGS